MTKHERGTMIKGNFDSTFVPPADPPADDSEGEHEVENPPIKALLNDLGGMLGAQMPEGWGFTLLLFTYGEDGSLFYISSANRQDMLNTMAEFIGKKGQ